jgi:hypothetical protein
MNPAMSSSASKSSRFGLHCSEVSGTGFGRFKIRALSNGKAYLAGK